MNALLLMLALTVQAPTLDADGWTVSGDVVTVSADFAWIEPAAGGTSPVADQTTWDYGSLVGVGVSASNMLLVMANSGVQAP